MSVPAHIEHSLIGTGIYTIPEAARLTQIHANRIRRWVKGYSYVSGDKRHSSLPVFDLQLAPINGHVALGFLDLVEVRFISAFRDAGVTWPVLRTVYPKAVDLIGTDHPFCTRRFKTDGTTVIAELVKETGEKILLNLLTQQFALQTVIAPYLYKGLIFSDDKVSQWWPLGEDRKIVIDPDRMFGQPIVADAGIPTAVLARAYRAEQSFGVVARWYDVDEGSVADAVEYEQRLAA